MTDRPPLRITDPKMMRALAHPARMTILEYLGQGGAATATECADIVGLTPSATSYHLRALAKWGLVEDAPGRGDGRERVWQATFRGWGVYVGPAGDAESQQAEQALSVFLLDREHDRVRRWVAGAADESPEWYHASLLSESTLRLTADELAELAGRITELIRPYLRSQRPAKLDAARDVSAIVRFYPRD